MTTATAIQQADSPALYTPLPPPNKPEYGAAYFMRIHTKAQWARVWFRSKRSPEKVWVIVEDIRVGLTQIMVEWETVQEGKYDSMRSVPEMPAWAGSALCKWTWKGGNK